jgi:hypothetical protein
LFTTPVVYLYLDRLRLWGLALYCGRAPRRQSELPKPAAS